MNDKVQRFRFSQDPFLSWRFLSFREFKEPNPLPGKSSQRYFTFWARNAIYYSLKAAGLSPGDEVLVPAYVCKVVPEAVAGCGARAVFYHVGRNCRADFADLEAKTSKRTRAVIAVHYFGFPQPIGIYRDYCTRHGLFLVEDCAHVLHSKLNGQPLGTFGDASVFSWRKFFPLFDGGELILNLVKTKLDIDWCRENPLLALRIAKDIVDQLVAHSAGLPSRIVRFLIQSLKVPLLGLLRSGTSETLLVEKTDSTFDPRLINHQMSRFSRMILSHSNALNISRKRKANYLFLQRELEGMSALRFLEEELPEEVCPWVFPLYFAGVANACTALRELGIPAVTWDGVRPTGLQWELFPDEDFLYSRLIFLPVHQNLTTNDLQQIVRAVKQVHQQVQRA